MTWKRVLMVLAAAAVIVAAVVMVKVAAELRQTHTGAARPTATSPAPSPSTAASPATVARTVADRFCQPAATKNTWQRSLTPYLTADAWQLYSAVQPANVPCAGVHDDDATVGDQQTATDRAYQFTASTGGPVTVTVHRDSPQEPWLASYINAQELTR